MIRHRSRPRAFSWARRGIYGIWTVVILLAAAATLVDAHDLFLKPENFFVSPRAAVRVQVLNGTFTTSEGSVARDRLRELTVAGPEGVSHPDTNSWQVGEKASSWNVSVGGSGTYVLGASVLPRTLRLEAKDFNKYLAEDGIPDVLALRRQRGELDRPARERYSKHVKALVQVGDERSTDVGVRFGHPAELVPLDNPYKLRSGATLRVQALVDGQPVPNQVVLAGGHTAQGARIAEKSARTTSDGIARIPLRARGVWYVKFIRMQPIPTTAGDSVDYESKWATLTFAIK